MHERSSQFKYSNGSLNLCSLVTLEHDTTKDLKELAKSGRIEKDLR